MTVRCPLLGGACNYQGVLIGSCPNQATCAKLAQKKPPPTREEEHGPH